jgi:hypothetical protein
MGMDMDRYMGMNSETGGDMYTGLGMGMGMGVPGTLAMYVCKQKQKHAKRKQKHAENKLYDLQVSVIKKAAHMQSAADRREDRRELAADRREDRRELASERQDLTEMSICAMPNYFNF